mgnify:CR=1 FL=1
MVVILLVLIFHAHELSIIHIWLSCEAELLGNVGIVEEIVLPEDASLSLLIDHFLVGNDIGGVHLGDDIHAISHVSRAVACTSNLASLCLSIQFETF